MTKRTVQSKPFDVEAEFIAASRKIALKIDSMARDAINRIWDMYTFGTGVCHCGCDMESHSGYDNHMALEMRRDKSYGPLMPPASDTTNIPAFLQHLEDDERDPEAAKLARKLLAAGWQVRTFWGPEQMDVWNLQLQSDSRIVMFGIERGFSDGILVGEDKGSGEHLYWNDTNWRRTTPEIFPRTVDLSDRSIFDSESNTRRSIKEER